MTATAVGLQTRQVRGPRPGLRVAAFSMAAVVVGIATTAPSLVRGALAISVAALAMALCLRTPRTAIVVLVVWLVALGLLRRLLLGAAVQSANDPLLLVMPVGAAVLVVVAARRGAFTSRSQLSGGVLLLSLVVAAGALNPLQGGPAVGAAGLLFLLVPMLWFWVGRALVDDRLLSTLLWLVAGLSVAAAAYGLFQVYRGFPPWDADWIKARGYTSLQVSGSSRQFASFSSASEYVIFIAMGIVIWLLALLRNRVFLAGGALAVLGWALALASVRGVLVGVVVTIGVTVAVSRGFGITRTLLSGLVALLVLSAVVTRLDPASVGGARTSALLSRQVTGLSDPLNPESSTVSQHLQSIFGGLRAALTNPIGRGTGAVSIAADRFGNQSQITETDPSNLAVALGLPGVFAYLMVLFLAFRLAFRRARKERNFLSLAVLGVLLITNLQWLNGGNYAVAFLPWLLLGWLDRPPDESGSPAGRETTALNGSPTVA